MDAVPISLVMDEASRVREQVGGVVTEALPEGLANRQQITATIERIGRQETSGARHHHLVGAACELFALGCGMEVAESVLENLIRRQGREPTLREVRDAWTYAQQRSQQGTLRTDNPPVAATFAAPPTPPTPQQAAVNLRQNDSLAMEVADWTSNDYLNGRLFLRLQHPDGTLVRSAEMDYEWTGAHWSPLPDPEVLEARIARVSEMKASKVAATAKSVRSQVHEENLAAPCWRATRRDASRIVAFRNGNLDVEKWAQGDTGAFTAPDPDLFVTSSAPYDYDPDATSPVFDAFLDSIFPGDDQAKRECLKMLGYLLTPDTTHQKMFIFGGVPGSGKSTFANIIRMLVGRESCCAPSIASLSTNFGPTGLLGKSVALVSEANNGGDIKTVPMAAVDLIKRITGRDEVQIDRKHKAVVTLALPLRFVFACNRLPHFIDPSGAMARRIQLFWFRHSHVGREDLGLSSRLELELPGIANRALEGLRYLLEDGKFKQVDSSAEVMRNYVRQMSPVGAFVEDCLQASPGSRVPRSALLEVYRAWVADSGRQLIGAERLVAEVSDAMPGVREVRAPDGARTRTIEGVALTETGRAFLSSGAAAFP
jgi:putative DNA primase/helicase